MLYKRGNLLALFALSALCTALHGQSEDNSKFFDDDLKGRRNLLKFDGTAFVIGELGLGYERLINREFSVEVGYASLLPRFNTKMGAPFVERWEVNDPIDSGHSFLIYPKIYKDKEAPYEQYYGILWRQRRFDQGGRTFLQNQILWQGGFQSELKEKILYDISMGMGLHNERQVDNPNADKINAFTLTVNVRLVYLF